MIYNLFSYNCAEIVDAEKKRISSCFPSTGSKDRPASESGRIKIFQTDSKFEPDFFIIRKYRLTLIQFICYPVIEMCPSLKHAKTCRLPVQKHHKCLFLDMLLINDGNSLNLYGLKCHLTHLDLYTK